MDWGSGDHVESPGFCHWTKNPWPPDLSQKAMSMSWMPVERVIVPLSSDPQCTEQTIVPSMERTTLSSPASPNEYVPSVEIEIVPEARTQK